MKQAKVELGHRTLELDVRPLTMGEMVDSIERNNSIGTLVNLIEFYLEQNGYDPEIAEGLENLALPDFMDIFGDLVDTLSKVNGLDQDYDNGGLATPTPKGGNPQ